MLQNNEDKRIFKAEHYFQKLDNSAKSILNFNTDSAFSVLFEDQLRVLDNVVKKVIYADSTFMMDIPSKLVPVATETFTWQMNDMTGSAQEISDYATDITEVGVKGKRYTNCYTDFASSFTFSIREMQAAQQSGMPLSTNKLEVALFANTNFMNLAAYKGNATKQVLGWLSYNSLDDTVPVDRKVTTMEVVAGVGGKTWATKTGDEILKDLYSAINTVDIRTTSKFEVDTILLPPAQYIIAAQTRLLPTQTITVLEEFNRQYPGITVLKRPILKGALKVGNAYKDIMIAYKKAPFHFEQIIAEVFAPQPEQIVNLAYKTICTSKHLGVAMYYPESQVFCYGI